MHPFEIQGIHAYAEITNENKTCNISAIIEIQPSVILYNMMIWIYKRRR